MGWPGSRPRQRWQVWPLHCNSFLFPFSFVKYHWFAWRSNQWPLTREILFSSVLTSNSLDSVSHPWTAFCADTAPFKGPWLASYVASKTTEIQGRHQVCHDRHGGPRASSRTIDAIPDWAFLLFQILGRPGPPLPFLFHPPGWICIGISSESCSVPLMGTKHNVQS